jgi:hypothetical protein
MSVTHSQSGCVSPSVTVSVARSPRCVLQTSCVRRTLALREGPGYRLAPPPGSEGRKAAAVRLLARRGHHPTSHTITHVRACTPGMGASLTATPVIHDRGPRAYALRGGPRANAFRVQHARHPTDGSCGAAFLRAVTSLLTLRKDPSPLGERRPRSRGY